jgi:hypothetical protein
MKIFKSFKVIPWRAFLDNPGPWAPMVRKVATGCRGGRGCLGSRATREYTEESAPCALQDPKVTRAYPDVTGSTVSLANGVRPETSASPERLEMMAP